MYTVKEVADIIGVSTSTIYRRMADVTIDGQRRHTLTGKNGQWLLTEHDLMALTIIIKRSIRN